VLLVDVSVEADPELDVDVDVEEVLVEEVVDVLDFAPALAVARIIGLARACFV